MSGRGGGAAWLLPLDLTVFEFMHVRRVAHLYVRRFTLCLREKWGPEKLNLRCVRIHV